MRSGYRYARQPGFELRGTEFHPLNSLSALQLSLREVCGSDKKRLYLTFLKPAGLTAKILVT